jgi:hypothetical protein
MALSKELEALRNRTAPIEIPAAEFRDIGHRLVDRIADHLAGLRELPVAPADNGAEIRRLLGAESPLPEEGADPGLLLRQAAELLFAHSLFNGHPRFFGYITSSAAPAGVLGDFLAAAVNPNVGAWKLAPMATEVEAQTVRWIAELVGYPSDCGGLLVSGGNMANFVCFLAARTAKASWDVRKDGLDQTEKRLRVMHRRRRTLGFKRPRTFSAWAPAPSAGFQPAQSNAWIRIRCAAASTMTCGRAISPSWLPAQPVP